MDDTLYDVLVEVEQCGGRKPSSLVRCMAKMCAAVTGFLTCSKKTCEKFTRKGKTALLQMNENDTLRLKPLFLRTNERILQSGEKEFEEPKKIVNYLLLIMAVVKPMSQWSVAEFWR